MSNTNVTKDAANKTLVVERVFDAPRDRVWRAWTDPEILVQWWGPRGWETVNKRFEFEPGGVWHYCMTCLDPDQGDFFEQESWGKATFLEINPPEGFIYKDEFSDANGKTDPEMPTMTITMEFHDEDGKTRIVSRSVFDSTEGYEKVIAMGVVEGLTQTWDRLDELVTAEVQA